MAHGRGRPARALWPEGAPGLVPGKGPGPDNDIDNDSKVLINRFNKPIIEPTIHQQLPRNAKKV